MQNQNIIITGLTGYIGKNLSKNLDKFNLYSINRNNLEILFKNINQENEFTLLHLATHFSTDIADKNLVYESNIKFGEKILKTTENLKIKKIIYTNTMYNFYKDEHLRNSYYSKTKKNFSNILINYCDSRNILFEEIYLDNTFGPNDKRKKLIPVIIENIKNKETNPIKNPNNSINLMHIDDVIKRLLISIKSREESQSTSFISSHSYNVNSIYEFLKYFYVHGEVNDELIINTENNYLSNIPKIEYKGLKIKDNLIRLTKLL